MNDEKDPSGYKCTVLKDGKKICTPIKPEGDKKKEGTKVGRIRRVIIESDEPGDATPAKEGGE